MKFLRNASALALLGLTAATSAGALTLSQAAHPKETPPASYSGDVYVDSRGCAYVRATIGNQVNWVPRLGNDRKTVICGMAPSLSGGGQLASAPPPPPVPPAPEALAAATTTTASAPATTAARTTAARTTGGLFGSNLPTPSPAPAPTVFSNSAAAAAPAASAPSGPSRTLTVTCPADGSTARVRVGADTVRLNCAPNQTRVATVMVRHGNGEITRLQVNPAPAAPVVASVASAPVALPVSSGTTLSGGRVRIGGVPPGGATNGFGRGYGVLTSGGAVTAPGPAARVVAPATVPMGTMLPAGVASVAPALPEGYRPAFTDDRLNPQRGPRSVQGDLQMAQVYDTSRVPMRLVAAPQPAGLRTQASGGTYVLSTSNAASARAVTTAPAPVATGKRYVQVGAFNVAANAERAVARLKGLGLRAFISPTSSGASVVVAGPYTDAGSLGAALNTARRGGFADAFARS